MINYFTCTLGHGHRRRQQGLDNATPFRTVLHLIDEQARHAPSALALGFASPTPESLTFDELRLRSNGAAGTLASCVGPPPADAESRPRSVGLLCVSSLDFVLTWLGLMRLGWSVLLLAPQLDAPAARHLCTALGIDVVLADDANVEGARRIRNGVRAVAIPSYDAAAPEAGGCCPTLSSSDTAYFFHSSGTSSGLPKPICQTHLSAAGALPRFPVQSEMEATFTTTPLYHGGLADAMRSWTAGAPIWLFPERLMPITAANVVRAVNVARSRSAVGYFSSVPYVLQRLAEHRQALELLRSMAVVAFGGAALPVSVGDGLVDAGVKLSSRFGSAECGFLMSSHRDYSVDREWQYLRPVYDPHLLTFEPRDDDLCELVVRPGWPVRAKTNRPDGSYATSDLFQPHPWRPNTWRYHSRADSQIVLLNGKKFDPAPMEADILASTTSLLRDVLIFGTGKDYPGILLFPAADTEAGADVANLIWPVIDTMNAATASHSRLIRPMLIPIRDELPLDKSSKGSILRRQAEERYAQAIESAYHVTGPSSSSSLDTHEQLLPTVLSCFQQVLGRHIDPHEQLFRQGVDSIASIQIRNLLQSCAITEKKLPVTILYDKGTVDRLVVYLERLRNDDEHDDGEEEKELDTMQHLADKYSDFSRLQVTPREKKAVCITLTGATGFLGAHVLKQLLHNTKVMRVYCLVRASTQQTARGRVSSSLSTLGLGTLDDAKVGCIPYDISSTGLGLEETHRQLLLRETTAIVHLAWAVNFSFPLGSFEHHIAGTRELISMAVESCSRFFFISSTAAVSLCASTPVPERLSERAADASPLGYARSKWVTERVCAAASEHLYRLGLAGCVSIIRVGQLCGDEAGVWNASEAYPLMLSTASLAGCLPHLPRERLDWLPVELAARAVMEICLPTTATPETTRSEATRVYHVVNPSTCPPTWRQLLEWLSQDSVGPSFDIVPPETWLLRLEQALKDGETNHPAEALLELWKDSYCRDKGACPQFSVEQSQRVSATMGAVEPLDRERLIRIWRWICQTRQ
ncbi:hypothetical protein L249_3145 [Ophiocordyceps polyrhachis-furcata BCC 54312]|uniref:Carrier domain-containing protein n=1 Tax=Ophiocordyceps polyrhachis-furcata BCC 54312 TaxID=1330021 RepID=A0A367LP70_9HYPO|nr:hypothetical protein L249_3145 [Ophiocordyceps polyrhachis-furcata BCC 54312]